MSPRSREVVEQLLRWAKPLNDDYIAVELEPTELRGIPPSLVSDNVLVRIATPRDLQTQNTAMKGVELSRSGQHVVVDIFLYRERDQWELPLAPEVYERLLEHVVTVREDATDRGTPSVNEKVRYYKPSFTTTDVELALGILLDASTTSDLAVAHLIGVTVAAELHAAALRLALREEGIKVIRESRSDPAIPVANYLELKPDVLAERRAAFDQAMARSPRKLVGIFGNGMVTVQLAQELDGRYQIQIISILARAGKFETEIPVPADEVVAWCERAGGPVDAFEWSAEE